MYYEVYTETTIERPERSTGVSLGSACAQGTGSGRKIPPVNVNTTTPIP